MAYMDYKHCELCEDKVYYDAEVDYEMDGHGPRWGVGDMAVLCKQCAKTYQIKIVQRRTETAQK